MDEKGSTINIWKYILAYIGVSLSIVVLGIITYQQQRADIDKFAKEELDGIAQLKVKQIVLRREERLIDASYIFHNTFMIDDIAAFQKNPSNAALHDKINHYLENIGASTYECYYLLDPNLSVLLTDAARRDPVDSATKANIALSLTDRRPYLSDIYLNQKTRVIQTDLVIPLFLHETSIGFIILVVDPNTKFFPIVQEWPTPSKSAETLIAEEMNGRVVFVNELRHIHNTPLKLSRPMSDTNLLSVKGLHGRLGIVEGIDYRDMPVIGAIASVPGTKWIVVAKMDKQEIFEPAYKRALIIFASVLLLILFAGAALYYRLKGIQRAQQAQLLESENLKISIEKELQESEKRFHAMFSNMNEGAVMHSLIFDEHHNPIDYKLISLNPAFERNTGIKIKVATGAIGSELYGLIPPPYFDIYSHTALTGIPNSFETFYPPLNKHFLISVFSPKKDWFTTIFTDITETKTAEAKLRESEELFSTLARLSPVGLFRTDMNGIITYWNEKLLKITGMSADNIAGKNCLNGIYEEDKGWVEKAWNDFIKSECSLNIQFRFKHANGAFIWVIGQAEIITRGTKKEILCTLTDVNSMKIIESELKNSLSLLEQSNKELEQFAYVASHDLQEPLRMVSSYTQLLAKKYKDVISGDGVGYINFAVDGAQRMQLLINDLLDYSRITRQNHLLEPISTSRVLGVVISNLRKKIEESGAIITNDHLPQVLGNEQQLIRVFQNLLDNAIKYHGDEAPMVHVSAQPQEDRYCFSIKDNGIGIDGEYKDKVFEIFERLHSTSAYPGTGIGLSICKKVIEKLGGEIWIEPNKDKGVTFYFTLMKGTGNGK
jgi:PAS domain S-box-containing protein